MPARRTLTVSVTAEQDTLIRACLQSGRYTSASEVVRAALRLLEREVSGTGRAALVTTLALQVQDRV